MKFEYDGRTCELDVSDPLLSHAVAIQEFTGLSLADWSRSLFDPTATAWVTSIRAAYWLMLAQGGDSVKIGDTPDFRPVSFADALVDAWTAEAKAAAAKAGEPDPTKPAAGLAAAEPKPPATG
jgi:hypothetical protein